MQDMRIVGVVQARMTSTRLPGKVLREVLGKPLLEYELERLKKIPLLDELVVATTTNVTDDPVAALCDRLCIPVYRGSEFDVLSRYYEAATLHKADAVVRFTADCPLIDPELSGSVIAHYLDNSDSLDYCSMDVSTYPRGVDTEICSFAALREAHEEGSAVPEREHVTYFIWNRPERYAIWRKNSGHDWGKYRLTVDTPEDFALIREIIEKLYPCNRDFSVEDVMELFKKIPELPKINEAVRQKDPHVIV
jgi:spore coat polysaccharide biosynthesis protein SpsF